jgi:hypothetical protein
MKLIAKEMKQITEKTQIIFFFFKNIFIFLEEMKQIVEIGKQLSNRLSEGGNRLPE